MPGKAMVNDSRFTIFQVSDLKDKHEEFFVNSENVMKALIYDINMYLSIKVITIRRDLRYFTKKPTTATKIKINL